MEIDLMKSEHPSQKVSAGSLDDSLNVEKRWTISNLLSVSRVLLLIPIVVLILKQDSGDRAAVLVLMLIAVITDFLDGFLARSLNQVTDFGKLLDPVADKICIVAAAAALVVVGDVPLWYAVAVGLRDALILIGGSLILKKKKIVVQSVWAGKLAVNFVAGYFIFATIRLDSLVMAKDFFLYLSTVFLFISLIVYFRIYQKQISRTGI